MHDETVKFSLQCSTWCNWSKHHVLSK